MAPTESKADDGFRIYISPEHSQYRPYYYGGDRHRYHHHADEYRWQRWHRTIIGTITIEILNETKTGIDLLRFRITNWLSAA